MYSVCLPLPLPFFQSLTEHTTADHAQDMVRRNWLLQNQNLLRPSALRTCLEKNIIAGDSGPSLAQLRAARFARQQEAIRLSNAPLAERVQHNFLVHGGGSRALPAIAVSALNAMGGDGNSNRVTAPRHLRRRFEPHMPLAAVPQSVRYLSTGLAQRALDADKFKAEQLGKVLRQRTGLLATTGRSSSSQPASIDPAAVLARLGIVHHQTQPL